MQNSSDDSYDRRTAAELATFDHNVNVHDLPAIFHYWSHNHLRPKFESLGIRGINEFYEDWMCVAVQRTQSSAVRFASIGAGNCDVEVHLAKVLRDRGLKNFVIQCVELNPTMLQRGQHLATSEGVSDLMSFTAADFNLWEPDVTYDAIIANQSLHHVLDLEHLFGSIQRSLKYKGLFISSDMIGRNGHMRWPEALSIVHEFWREMPERYRYNFLLNRTEPLYDNWDCSSEGFEGIRAQDVLRLLTKYFKFELFLGFGNVIDIFVDRCFGHHFSIDGEWDRRFIDRVHARDDESIESGLITPTHMIAVMSNEDPPTQKFWNGQSPERFIRVAD